MLRVRLLWERRWLFRKLKRRSTDSEGDPTSVKYTASLRDSGDGRAKRFAREDFVNIKANWNTEGTGALNTSLLITGEALDVGSNCAWDRLVEDSR